MTNLPSRLTLLVCLVIPVNLGAQEQSHADSATRKSGTYLKAGLAQWQGNIFSQNSLTQWDVDLFGADYELTSVNLTIESYFKKTLLQLSGLSVGYRKDNLHRAESGHMISGAVFRDLDLKAFALKASVGIEWGMPSFNFDQTEFASADDGTIRYRHTYIYRNTDIPFIGTTSDGVAYPFIELSVVQRPWFLLFETGMRIGFPTFNLDDYEIGPTDRITHELNRKRVVVPYVFADIGFRLF